MNLPEVERLLRSVMEHAEIAASVLADETLADRERELELIGRCNYIDARMAQLHAELVRREVRV